MLSPRPLPFSVEYSPCAWAQVGTLGREDFLHLQEALQQAAWALAERPVHATPPGASDGTGEAPGLVVGELLVRLQVDADRRVVTVLELARVPPGPR
jgi:hypothetical protein